MLAVHHPGIDPVGKLRLLLNDPRGPSTKRPNPLAMNESRAVSAIVYPSFGQGYSLFLPMRSLAVLRLEIGWNGRRWNESSDFARDLMSHIPASHRLRQACVILVETALSAPNRSVRAWLE
jgi:hypothetical protein